MPIVKTQDLTDRAGADSAFALGSDQQEPDDGLLRPEALSMGTLTREINLRKRPNRILRRLMSALESQRMEKRMGWSRPWNKYGLNIFRSHILNLSKDADLLAQTHTAVAGWLTALPPAYAGFLEDLSKDPAAMAFTFYHNHRIGDARFEGLTLSLGRKVPGDKTKRDRMDLILEDRCVDGRVDGILDRARLYLNPYSRYAEGELLRQEWSGPESPLPAGLQEIYSRSLEAYHLWKEDPDRQWEHWSVRYIDYFGARSFLPEGTSFT